MKTCYNLRYTNYFNTPNGNRNPISVGEKIITSMFKNKQNVVNQCSNMFENILILKHHNIYVMRCTLGAGFYNIF